jgi:hypothetical protein
VVISHAWYCPALRERLAAASVPWHNHTADDMQGWFDGAGLALIRDRVADVARWPVMAAGAGIAKEASVLGGIGIRTPAPGRVRLI